MKKFLLLFLAFGLFYTGCKKNDDSPVVDQEQQDPEPDQDDPNNIVDFQVQDFMWQTMNRYYLWQDEIVNLADEKFPNTAEEEQGYIDFLASEANPADFFDNMLLAPQDRFSGYRENYKDLVNSLAGVSKSNGLEFGLVRFANSNDIFGFVEYVAANSDASTKNIKRGDLFTGVNGQTLNVNNYIDLLFGDEDTYTLNMAFLENNTITQTTEEVTLTKVENFVEDPILVNQVLELSGQKIGYIMYNQFVGGSGERLNEIFGEFKAMGVTDLVLDLRYNLGGRGSTATILASLIHSTDENKLFYKDKYNSKLQPQFDPSSLENNFVSTTGSDFGNMNTALNGLNLGKIYILATDGSASASELIMAGLDPYMEIVHIGSTTVGKNQGSVTFVDDPENGNFYDEDRESFINPDNQWAIQPIIVTVENSAGFSDYTAGFAPDFPLEEDLANLGVLGDANEPLLAKALEEITGVSSKRSFDVKMPVKLLTSSKMHLPFSDNLVIDKIPMPLKTQLEKQRNQ